jgi:undecaprenyl-diphosphatase
MMSAWKQRLGRWRDRIEIGFLLPLLLITAGVWGFVALADEVLEGETHAFDTALLLALRDGADRADPLGPPWFEDMVRDLTAVGGVAVLSLLTLAVIGFFLLQGKTRTALLVAVSVGGGSLLSYALKLGFDRPRPDLVAHGAHVMTASFPSGHSMLSAVTYLTLGGLLAHGLAPRRLKVYVMSLALLLTLLVGATRIYLGVHWPTDVLAGWAAGASWALICWTAVHRLDRGD